MIVILKFGYKQQNPVVNLFTEACFLIW
jgi:hypothetical protein